ncbi:MAG: hypothetical protein ACW99U_21750 [Candidatus Thorarchaeota archaeon]|jgi:hypothetical protein
MTYRIEKYHTEHVSWKTGVSPKRVCKWRIVRDSDGRVMEHHIETKKKAEYILNAIPKAARES